jgi:hypothetical protein
MEISALGGISGFTLTGAMNTKADWATLTTKSLTFTPTYEFIDVAAQAAQAAQAASAPSIAMTTEAITLSNMTDCTVTGLTIACNINGEASTRDFYTNSNVTWSNDKQADSDGNITVTLGGAWPTIVSGQEVTLTLTYTKGGQSKTTTKTVDLS